MKHQLPGQVGDNDFNCAGITGAWSKKKQDGTKCKNSKSDIVELHPSIHIRKPAETEKQCCSDQIISHKHPNQVLE